MAAHKRISIEVGIHIDITRGLRKSISIQMRLLQCTTLLYKTKPVLRFTQRSHIAAGRVFCWYIVFMLLFMTPARLGRLHNLICLTVASLNPNEHAAQHKRANIGYILHVSKL